MIGVLADGPEAGLIEEFFELFKTPWGLYREGGGFDVVICSGDRRPDHPAKLVLIYGSEETDWDRLHGLRVRSRGVETMLPGPSGEIPVYERWSTFEGTGVSLLTDPRSSEALAFELPAPSGRVVRLGFDLFREIRHLLTEGQPVCHAATPTVEMHIDLLRRLIVGSGIRLVEIPPVPAGYNFIACLTHDVDHAEVRRHKWDRALAGFLYRATFGSLLDFCVGRRSLGDLGRNWAAVVKLPFVFLGVAKDFWLPFERYLEIEKGLVSTFFFTPRKGEAGLNSKGEAVAMRAARYDLADLVPELARLTAVGDEIGLHGIDAWRDAVKGREERERIAQLSGQKEMGVRMHWLYFDQNAPARLEEAGLSYDSTSGYNETVGYRVGTTQVFKPLGLKRLLELPMHVMDTALFYPCYRNLSRQEAWPVVEDLVRKAEHFGGVLTVNWHDRSVVPERLWGGFYIDLLADLKQNRAWFATAADTVSWFRMRRAALIEGLSFENETLTVKAQLKPKDHLPGLTIRVHNPASGADFLHKPGGLAQFVDAPLCEHTKIAVAA
jgi:hypothetical protein